MTRVVVDDDITYQCSSCYNIRAARSTYSNGRDFVHETDTMDAAPSVREEGIPQETFVPYR